MQGGGALSPRLSCRLPPLTPLTPVAGRARSLMGGHASCVYNRVLRRVTWEGGLPPLALYPRLPRITGSPRVARYPEVPRGEWGGGALRVGGVVCVVRAHVGRVTPRRTPAGSPVKRRRKGPAASAAIARSNQGIVRLLPAARLGPLAACPGPDDRLATPEGRSPCPPRSPR